VNEMYIWSIFEGYLAGFYTYPVAIPNTALPQYHHESA